MIVLVTGAAGFLGSHLCDRLLADGHSVIGLDNFFTGRKENIAHLATVKNFEMIRHDVTIPLEIQCDAILNFACPASPIHYQRDPIQTLRTSVLGALNLLELSRRTGARILQASTSEVYGDPEVSPQPETYWGNVNPHGTRACYDEGKRAVETLFMDYRRQFGTDTRIVRIFNTYGPRMAVGDGRVVSNFIVQSLKGEALTLYGDGAQTRSFCYVSDLVEGIVRALYLGPNPDGPINLGNPREIDMITLAKEITGITGGSLQFTHEGLPLDDPQRRCPDITRASEIINWTPSVSLKEGLAKTIKYFSSVLGV